MQNKMNLCMRKVYDTDVSQMRLEVFKIVAVDFEDIAFKFQEVYRILERNIENAQSYLYQTFDRYLGNINYEQELVTEINALLLDSYDIL